MNAEHAEHHEKELRNLASRMRDIEGRFKHTNSGIYLNSIDEATLKGLALEALHALKDAFPTDSTFAQSFVNAANENGGSISSVRNMGAILASAASLVSRGLSKPASGGYVDLSRLKELQKLSSEEFDFTRLVRLCEELNSVHAAGNLMSSAMLVRSIMDHVPPVFGHRTFAEVANNYRTGKSTKECFQLLEGSLRNIADGHLHVSIRKTETLPTPTQVDFRAALDVLLGEVVRLVK